MILYHPLSKVNDANVKVIARLKNRIVKVYCKSKKKWLAVNNEFICDVKKLAKELTFKDALKLTKKCLKQEGIEYHFEDGLGDEKPSIKDFDFENTVNCPTVIFDNDCGILKNN
jgi:hypothetical protein